MGNMTSNTTKCHIDFLTIIFRKYDQNVVKIYSFQLYFMLVFKKNCQWDSLIDQ